jgi:hypothetical protein
MFWRGFPVITQLSVRENDAKRPFAPEGRFCIYAGLDVLRGRIIF